MSDAQEQYYDMRDDPEDEPPKLPCPVDHLTLYYAWRLTNDEFDSLGLPSFNTPPPCPRCNKELKDE